MLRKDYIVRQFEELGKVMAIIFGLKKIKDWKNFEAEVNAASQKYTALEINSVENYLPIEFEAGVLNHPTLTNEQLHILADLLFEKLMYYIDINSQKQIDDLKNKCTQLYTLINSNQTQTEFNLDVHYKLCFLNKM